MTFVDKHTLKVTHEMPYPKKYGKSFWGDHPYLYLPSVQYSKGLDKLYISFPIEDEVFVYNSDLTFDKSVNVKSEKIDDILPLLKKPLPKEKEIDYELDKRYFQNLSYYLMAFYDEKNKQYFRVVRRTEKENDEEPKIFYSLIVCDEKLNRLGELELDEKYNLYYSFISPRGLMLFNSSRHINDSILPYDLVTVSVNMGN